MPGCQLEPPPSPFPRLALLAEVLVEEDRDFLEHLFRFRRGIVADVMRVRHSLVNLKGGLDAFYDKLRLPKGPSFGMRTTLICPFMYLAHYDMVTTQDGRAARAANGLDPDLLRLCVGTEPVDDIIAALSEALA